MRYLHLAGRTGILLRQGTSGVLTALKRGLLGPEVLNPLKMIFLSKKLFTLDSQLIYLRLDRLCSWLSWILIGCLHMCFLGFSDKNWVFEPKSSWVYFNEIRLWLRYHNLVVGRSSRCRRWGTFCYRCFKNFCFPFSVQDSLPSSGPFWNLVWNSPPLWGCDVGLTSADQEEAWTLKPGQISHDLGLDWLRPGSESQY